MAQSRFIVSNGYDIHPCRTRFGHVAVVYRSKTGQRWYQTKESVGRGSKRVAIAMANSWIAAHPVESLP